MKALCTMRQFNVRRWSRIERCAERRLVAAYDRLVDAEGRQ